MDVLVLFHSSSLMPLGKKVFSRHLHNYITGTSVCAAVSYNEGQQCNSHCSTMCQNCFKETKGLQFLSSFHHHFHCFIAIDYFSLIIFNPFTATLPTLACYSEVGTSMQYFISTLIVILKITFVSNEINFLLFYFAVLFLETESLSYGTRIFCRIILYSYIPDAFLHKVFHAQQWKG